MKTFCTLACFACLTWQSLAQVANPSLAGYWHNWNDGSAPYIALQALDPRYDIVNLAFAVPKAGTDYDMEFVPCCGETATTLAAKVQALQAQGKIVNISIGGATAPIELSSVGERDAFINSMNGILQTYGFDGMDIDLEGSSLSVSASSTIANPTDAPVLNFIFAVKQIMANYRQQFNRQLFLSAAPETAFVQGGMSAWGGIWGAYLPVLHALRDSMDFLHVQLYNSGSMYGIDGNIYSQGTADFIVSQVEAVIQGFNVDQWSNQAGHFDGFPANKVGVGLPACPSAAGGGFTNTAAVKAAVDYLRGVGPKPGAYTLVAGPYPDLGGMMDWSINWDAVNTCNPTAYEYATNFEASFPAGNCAQPSLGNNLSGCAISFPYTLNSNTSPNVNVTYTWTNLSTGQVLVGNSPSASTWEVAGAATYRVLRDSAGCAKSDEITIEAGLPLPALPASLNLCASLPQTLSVGNTAVFPTGTTWQWYRNNSALPGETGSSYDGLRSAGTYRVDAGFGACSSTQTTNVTSDLPEPLDGCGETGSQIALGISGGGNGPFTWHDSATGGIQVGTGTSYLTPALNASTTYFVQDNSSVGGGVTGPIYASNPFGTVNSDRLATQLSFDILAPITLQSVVIAPWIYCYTHNITVQVQDASGTVLASKTISVAADFNCNAVDELFVLCSFDNGGVTLPVGTGYKIVSSDPPGSAGIGNFSANVNYPMSYAPWLQITGSNASGRYLGVFDWTVAGGSCARLPVFARLVPDCTLPEPACVPNLTIAQTTIATGTYRSAGDLTCLDATVENGSSVVLFSDSGVLLQAGCTVEMGGELNVAIMACPASN